MHNKARQILSNLTLSQGFMLAGLFILLAGMFGIGLWVEKQILTGVVHRSGATTALYVDSFIAPHLQELAQSDEISPAVEETLRKLLQDTPIGKQLATLKVWDTRGKLLFTTDTSIVGKTYPMHDGYLHARLGEVASDISKLDEVENQLLRQQYTELLETYSPVWLSGTDQIIAVTEFYQNTDELNREVGALKRRSWLVVGMAILLMYLLLAGFVRRASNTITRQQVELGQKVKQLTQLLALNRELDERVRRASGSVALLNEGYLRRVGSELHDGPAQDLGLAILKLDALQAQVEGLPDAAAQTVLLDQLSAIDSPLKNALKEMRSIATGLSLPQLSGLGFPETVKKVVHTHERRTGTQVSLALHALPEEVPMPVKITVYRLIQEALNNAFRHANGSGQQVRVSCENGLLGVEIQDSGPGFDVALAGTASGRLGLGGMRERVESLGGLFQIESQAGKGTRIFVRLPLMTERDNTI